MNKLIKISLALITSVLVSSSIAQAASMRKLQRRLQRSLKVEIKINNELMRNKESCTRKLLDSWSSWWREVESPYKVEYLGLLTKLESIEIKDSNSVQTIKGSYISFYHVKSICNGSGMGRSCKTMDSSSLMLKKDIKLEGETPAFDLNLKNNAIISLEYAEDWSSEKRYDTFLKTIYQNVERNNKLFDKYNRLGMVTQLIRPGTDSTLKKRCSFPRLDQILEKLK